MPLAVLRQLGTPHRNARNAGRYVGETAVNRERMAQILALRVQGYGWAEIGRGLGIDEGRVRVLYKKAMKNAEGFSAEAVKHQKALEMERLEFPMPNLAPRVQAGDDDKAIDSWIKLSESRRRLLGSDAPAKVDQRQQVLVRQYEGVNPDEV